VNWRKQVSVRFGIDRFLDETYITRSARIGLVTNDGACTAAYVPTRQKLLNNGYKLVKLFSPEHGLQAVGSDGHPMEDGCDPLTGISVRSLYGKQLKPCLEDLKDIDIVLVDLPDVGCRCYTYLWTITYVMEACAETGKSLVVLDRPNPISGIMNLAEGPGITDESCASFIGRWDIPLRHSCTFGELSRLWKATRLQNLDLSVVAADGWSREMFYHDWASSFVPTSPAIANAEACLLYPGLCLSEATNLSEGRGTPIAFRVLGAPWLRAYEVIEQFNLLQLPGVLARATSFVTEIGKYRGMNCHGVMLHVIGMRDIRSVLTAFMLIKLIRDMHQDNFIWATYPTAVNPTGEKHLDKLSGLVNAESLFDLSWREFRAKAESLLNCFAWKEHIAPHLLYT
jgi:uncharacterized protein YbbC (DUF1343 family)